ncbi:hypothetical protein [Larkinella soli]|uniref:hypothetical protein n=1 Tax=Larkinella soli TaxID=1770527 RepID=UPI0013E3DD37|nr:hypothetical protein [Larkinella soli]
MQKPFTGSGIRLFLKFLLIALLITASVLNARISRHSGISSSSQLKLSTLGFQSEYVDF